MFHKLQTTIGLEFMAWFNSSVLSSASHFHPVYWEEIDGSGAISITMISHPEDALNQ